MASQACLLLSMVGLLVAGCVSPSLVPTDTAVPARTSLPTSTVKPASPPMPTAVQASPHPAYTAAFTEAVAPIIITIVFDNNESDRRLETAWGFSCLVQGLDNTILFDTGGDSRILLSNMHVLGIDPMVVDVVVISHVHGDHVGGLAGFLQENHAVTVYLPQSFPQNIKDAATGAGVELVEVAGPVKLCELVHSTGELGARIKEQSLVIETAQGLVVITGCAHPGVVNVVHRAKELWGGDIHLVLGGFHLGGASEGKIAGIMTEFQQLGVERVAPCHCSGELARRLLRDAYGENFIPAGVGSRLEVRQ